MTTPILHFESLVLQKRDLSLLRGLFESRAMTPKHIASLYFDGRSEMTKKRLQKLKAAKLIHNRQRRIFELSSLSITRKGLLFLKEKGVLKDYPDFNLPELEQRSKVSPLTIHHELEVMDVKVAFHSAIRQFPSFSLTEFSTWPLLNEFQTICSKLHGREIPVKPDAHLRIQEKASENEIYEHTFFFELDRSTEVLDRLVLRASCYYDYYRSGSFAIRNGGNRSDYKEFPFRVLMVFKTPERRNNMAERLLLCNPPILTQVCLSTIEEVLADPLGAIWFRPLDYRKTVNRTPFERFSSATRYGYKRQTAREIFIDAHIEKMKILADEPNS